MFQVAHASSPPATQSVAARICTNCGSEPRSRRVSSANVPDSHAAFAGSGGCTIMRVTNTPSVPSTLFRVAIRSAESESSRSNANS